jgi:hypothetical protein
LGFSIPLIRTEYETRLGALINDVKAKHGTMPMLDLSKWASDERTKLARTMRRKQGIVSTAVLEMRDWGKYGVGGRSWKNVYGRAASRADDPYTRILKGATTPNVEISEVAIRGARLLKTTGSVFFVVGLGVSVSNVIMAEPAHRVDIAKREAFFAGGSALGAEVGIGLCLVFGVVSGGWGLLACGLVGGAAGGYLTDRVIYPAHTQAALREIELTGKLQHSYLGRSSH